MPARLEKVTTRLTLLAALLAATALGCARPSAYKAPVTKFRDLKAVNDEIRGSLRQIDDMVAVINNVTRLLNGVTRFLTTVGAAV